MAAASPSPSRARAPATASRSSAPARPTSPTPPARSRTRRSPRCAEAGIEFVELEVAIDGLTVATSPNNDAVTCLDIPALYALVGPESEGFANWSDANALATELGRLRLTSCPTHRSTVTGPGPESGTYDTFVEFAIADLAEERGQEDGARADYSQSPNDNVIVEGIEASDSSASAGWATRSTKPSRSG